MPTDSITFATLIWSTATGGAVDSSPTVVNGRVYVGSDDDRLYALNAASDQILTATDTCTYTWKTDKAWAGTCREMIVRLTDGIEHKANSTFK